MKITCNLTLFVVQTNMSVMPLHNTPKNIVFLWFIRVLIGPLVFGPLVFPPFLSVVSKPANRFPGGKYSFSHLQLLLL